MNFRILSIDYGSKRTGLAISDPMLLIASSLPTIKTNKLMYFLSSYIYEENIQIVVIGEPKSWKNISPKVENEIQFFIKRLYLEFPGIKIDRIDEQFTTKVAKKTLVGIKKKHRTNKYIFNQISATLILQSYLDKK